MKTPPFSLSKWVTFGGVPIHQKRSFTPTLTVKIVSSNVNVFGLFDVHRLYNTTRESKLNGFLKVSKFTITLTVMGIFCNPSGETLGKILIQILSKIPPTIHPLYTLSKWKIILKPSDKNSIVTKSNRQVKPIRVIYCSI